MGRLPARPQAVFTTAETGLHALALDAQREVLLYVPARYQADRPAPLVVLLHGAGGQAGDGLRLLQPWAEEAGLILLATSSQGSTWDVIEGGYGPDVELLNRALDDVFRRYAIKAQRIALGGFSDGASYALSLGLANGDLFTHILAFSPGFMLPPKHTGKPQVFISHGTDDQVLPVRQCSRRIVPALQRAGYPVLYREFDGQHILPPAIVVEAVRWFVDDH